MLKKTWFVALICALLAGAAYFPVLRAEFVWDDLIVQTYQVPNLKSFGDAFRPPSGLGQWTAVYYRPAVVLTYIAEERLNNAWFGAKSRDIPGRAAFPHALTLLTHLLATCAVVALAKRCLRDLPNAAWGVWTAGLVFALHPAHIETIAAVSGRSDSLATLFLVAALLTALHWRERRSVPALIGSSVLFLLALLSKEVAVAGLALLPLCLWLVPRDASTGGKGFRGWVWTSGFAVAVTGYAALRTWAGSGISADANYGAGENILRLFRACAFFIRKALFPWPHTPFVPDLPGTGETVAFLAVGAVLAAAAFYLYRRGTTLYLLCLLWFAAACAPALPVAVRNIAETPIAERYLYLPSVGFALALGAVAASLAATRFRKGCFTGLSLLVLVYGVTSRQGTQIWQTDFVLWSALTRQDPASRHAAPWLNLGTELTGRGDLEGAERCFRQALAAQYPLSGKDRGLVMNGLGALRLRQAQAKSNAGRLAEVPRLLEEAENFFAQGVGADPGAWLLWKNLGGTRLWRGTATMVTTGRYDRGLIEAACRDFDQALRLSPGNPGLLEIRRTCADFAAKAAIQP